MTLHNITAAINTQRSQPRDGASKFTHLLAPQGKNRSLLCGNSAQGYGGSPLRPVVYGRGPDSRRPHHERALAVVLQVQYREWRRQTGGFKSSERSAGHLGLFVAELERSKSKLSVSLSLSSFVQSFQTSPPFREDLDRLLAHKW